MKSPKVLGNKVNVEKTVQIQLVLDPSIDACEDGLGYADNLKVWPYITGFMR